MGVDLHQFSDHRVNHHEGVGGVTTHVKSRVAYVSGVKNHGGAVVIGCIFAGSARRQPIISVPSIDEHPSTVFGAG